MSTASATIARGTHDEADFTRKIYEELLPKLKDFADGKEIIARAKKVAASTSN